MASQLYPKGAAHLLGRATQANLLSDTIKLLFYAGSFVAADEFISDLVGGSIVARSGALAGKTITPGGSIGAVFDANDLTITALSGAAFSLVLAAKDTGSDATSPLLAKFEISTFTPNGSDVNVIFNASGLWEI